MNHTTSTTNVSMREGSTMRTISTGRRLLAGTILLSGLATGAIVAHADVFSQRAAAGLNQDLSLTPKTDWPAVSTTSCLSGTLPDCEISLAAGPGQVDVADVVNGPQTVPFWGFNVNGQNAGEYTLAGGATSTIKVPVGTTLTIDFSQDGAIADEVDLSFPSLPVADVSRNGNTYTVHATKVGTSVFQAGTNPDAPRQIAMGLVGVMIVTPQGCDTCVYDALAPVQDEAIVAMTDLDLEFANAPAAFDMAYFAKPRDAAGRPRQVYHVINGHAFPDTDVIDARVGDAVALRYVNAGVTDKTMGMLGLRQTLLGRNASAYTDPQTMIAPMVGPGETADVTVSIPVNALAGQRYSLVDQARDMNHGTDSGFGGAMTFLNVWAGELALPTLSNLLTDGSTLTADGSSSVATNNITGYQTAVTDTPSEPDWSTASTVAVTPAPTVAISSTGVGANVDQYVWLRVQQDGPGALWSAAAGVQVVAPGAPTVSGLVLDTGTGILGASAQSGSPGRSITGYQTAVTTTATEPDWTSVPVTSLASAATVAISATVVAGPGDHVWVRVQQDGAGSLFSSAASLVVPTPPPPAPLGAPVVDTVSLSGADLALTAHSDPATTLTAAEYSVGPSAAVGGNGAALAGSFGAATVMIAQPLDPTPASGDLIWVRVQDAAGTWSAAVSVTA